MLVDSHCHLDRLNLKPYDGRFGRLMEKTLAQGVGHMLCVSIDMESYPAMRELVAGYPQVSISAGVHPNEQKRREPEAGELVELARDPGALARRSRDGRAWVERVHGADAIVERIYATYRERGWMDDEGRAIPARSRV